MQSVEKPKYTIIIRPFRRQDQSGVRALILAGLAERWETLDPTMNADLTDIAATFADGRFLVARVDGTLVGCGGLLPVDRETGQIVRMSTAVTWRRRGVATRLLSALETDARTLGLYALILETTSSWHSAIQFYHRQGYQFTHAAAGDSYFRKKLD